jgi:hypothetical protein
MAGIALWSLAGLVGAAAEAGEYYDVILANRLVCRLRDPGGYGSVSERGSAVEKNVTEALSVENVGNPKMSIRTVGGLPAVYIGGTFLVQVRSGDAAGTGSSVASLARQWMGAFKQQFPRAEPVTKIGRGGGGSAASSGGDAGPRPRQPVVVPAEDRALVEEVERLLVDARALTEEDFAERSPSIATEAAVLIWRTSTPTEGSTCSDFDLLAGKPTALQSTLNGLKFAREASEASFGEQRTLVALTVVKRVRAALPVS